METEDKHATTLRFQVAIVDFATHDPAPVIRYFDRIDRARGKNDGTTPFVAWDELPEMANLAVGVRCFLEAQDVQVKRAPKTRPNISTRVVSKIPRSNSHVSVLKTACLIFQSVR